MSDTPRTDECIVVYPEENAYDMYVWADFARKLERENAALRADKERLDWLSTESGSKWAHHESEQINITRRAIDSAMKEVKP
jgi:hypothetical protein